MSPNANRRLYITWNSSSSIISLDQRQFSNFLREIFLCLFLLKLQYWHVIFSKDKDKQRDLSEELENVIDMMLSIEETEDNEDEGICDDLGVRRSGLIEKTLLRCRHHLAVPHNAEDHYRAVCRFHILDPNITFNIFNSFLFLS